MVNELAKNAEQQLAELGEQFAQWRSTKTRRGEPIPERLWTQALALCERLPRSQIRRRLRLSDRDFKKRQGLDVSKAKESSASALEATSFIELTEAVSWHEPSALARAEMLLERPDGTRLQLRYSGAVSEMTPIVDRFLRAR